VLAVRLLILALVLADSAVVVQVEPELSLIRNWNWLPAAVVLSCAVVVVTLLWLNSEVVGAEQGQVVVKETSFE
jgi:hypothetical protein